MTRRRRSEISSSSMSPIPLFCERLCPGRNPFLFTQGGREFLLEDLEEIALFRSNLRQHDVIEAGVGVFPYRLKVPFDGRPTGDLLGSGLRGDIPARGLKPFGIRQLRLHRPTGERPTEVFVRGLARVFLAPGAAHSDFGVARALSTRCAKSLDQLLVRLCRY